MQTEHSKIDYFDLQYYIMS